MQERRMKPSDPGFQEYQEGLERNHQMKNQHCWFDLDVPEVEANVAIEENLDNMEQEHRIGHWYDALKNIFGGE